MNKLDRIFNEKLSGHTTTPSTASWSRIEAGLSKKNSAITWMRWAAVLLPGAVAATLWFNKPAEAPVITPVADNKETPAGTNVAALPTPQGDVPVAPQRAAQSASHVTRKLQKPVPVTTPVPEAANQSPRPESIAMTEVAIEPAGAVSEVSEEVVAESKPIVLVYTLETISGPVEEEKKPSTFERAVELARTVKHSDPLGDLRVMKDEIFALDLRKKSTKKN